MGEEYNKIELEKAMREFLEHENKKEFISNNKRLTKKRKQREENIFYTNYPTGAESS